MVAINVFKVLYVTTHVLYTLFHLIHEYVIYFNNCIKSFIYEFLPETEKVKYIQHGLQKISKRPKHLTIILGTEENNIKVIAKLILWCITAQIPFISFHDYKGL